MNILKWAVAAAVAGAAVYAIGSGKLSTDGKFLGMVPDGAGFGLDDIAKGAVILALAYGGGRLIHSFGGPAPVVR